MTRAMLPLPTPERRRIVQTMSDYARELDAEADKRRAGGHDAVVRFELRRAAGSVRLVGTMVLTGAMSTRKARFWRRAVADYLELVRSADARGVIH